MKGNTSTYIDIAGMWIALNLEQDIVRREVNLS